MAKLFLHIGGFKTGSTAIQAFLKTNRDRLGKQGVLAPETGTDPGGRHLPLVRALVGRDVTPRLAAMPDAFAAELRRHADRDVVVSCETLEHDLGAALPYFRSLGRELRVILYVRNQPQRINSGYVQAMRMLRSGHDWSDHLAEALIGETLRYSTWLMRDDIVPHEIDFRAYTGAARRDVAADFLAALGVAEPSPGFDRTASRNVSVSAVGVAALRMLAEFVHAKGIAIAVPVRNVAIAMVEKADAALGRPAFNGFGSATFEHVRRHFAGDNAWFAHEVWDAAWSELFARDAELDRESDEIDIADPAAPGHAEARTIFEKVRRYVVAQPSAPRATARRHGADAPRLGAGVRQLIGAPHA